MIRRPLPITAALALTALLAVPHTMFAAQAQNAARAQKNIASETVRTQALAAHADKQQETRKAVTSLMSQPEVQKVATRLGLDVTDVESAVASLTPQELDRLAAPVAQANNELAGGSTVIISTTTLLLIIIIVILVAD